VPEAYNPVEDMGPGIAKRILTTGAKLAGIGAMGAAGLVRAHGPEAMKHTVESFLELNTKYGNVLNQEARRSKGRLTGELMGYKSHGDVDVNVVKPEGMSYEIFKLLRNRSTRKQTEDIISNFDRGTFTGIAVSPRPDSTANPIALMLEGNYTGPSTLHELGAHLAADRLRPSTTDVLAKSFLRREGEIMKSIDALGYDAKQIKKYFDTLYVTRDTKDPILWGVKARATQEILGKILEGYISTRGPERHLQDELGRRLSAIRYAEHLRRAKPWYSPLFEKGK
jgi:hypothetical protein